MDNLDIQKHNNSNNMEDPSIIENLKKTITLKANSWNTTFQNTFFNIFGTGISHQPTFNKELSDKLTSLFVNTNVYVLISLSKKVYIKSLPVKIESDILKQQNLVTDKKINNEYTIGFNVVDAIVKNNNKEGGESKVVLTSDGKIDCNIEDVTVEVSSNFINCFNSDEELIAIILDEIFTNTTLFYNQIVKGIAGWGIVGGVMSSYISMVYEMVAHASDPKRDITMDDFKYTIASLVLTYLVIYISISYIHKRTNLIKDELVVKVGYGEALVKALENYNKYLFSIQESKSDALKGLSILDKIGHSIGIVFSYILNAIRWTGLTGKQSIGHRYDTINRNIELANKEIE